MSGVPGVLLLLGEQDTAQGFLIDFIPEPFLFFFLTHPLRLPFLYWFQVSYLPLPAWLHVLI